jgi:hypothetical protein
MPDADLTPAALRGLSIGERSPPRLYDRESIRNLSGHGACTTHARQLKTLGETL